MDDGPRSGNRSPRDESCHSYDLSNAIYGMLPSRAADISRLTSNASCPVRSRSGKRQRTVDAFSIPQRSISLGRNSTPPSWLSQTNKRVIMRRNEQMELHQSTCLNLTMASDDSTESDLWILPDFDDWELETEQATPAKKEGEWAPLLRRAAKSNLERLRARLEGDGWDFVGGKYDEDKQALQEAASHGEESVDEEFDVVVLPVVQASC
ncbi:Nn.00g032860.m01.CDS01 [Neocucurbitaria sp. VM-36]